ncbi:kunitz-type serine protease inhibitor 6-like [Amphiura filiformis]|uniref:kunitz-type serine protease inhibitor 6-like n=1 Tax=Amphiura filiformis TaxID=82378 RepID=UPI003B227DE4
MAGKQRLLVLFPYVIIMAMIYSVSIQAESTGRSSRRVRLRIINARAINSTSVKVTWRSASRGVTGYRVILTSSTGSRPVNTSSTARRLVVTGLDAETSYQVTVQPYINGVLVAGESSEAVAITTKEKTPTRGYSGRYTVAAGVCHLPRDPCPGSEVNGWIYDIDDDNCVRACPGEFHYGTEEECQINCEAPTGGALRRSAGDDTPSSATCHQPSDPGLCRAYMPRYYYNYIIGECQVFIYGGCGGNDNRYYTLEECQSECP